MNGICALWRAFVAGTVASDRRAGPVDDERPIRFAFFANIQAGLAVYYLRNGPWSVPDSHATLRRSETRFDSWRGRFSVRSPRVCRAHGGVRSRKAGSDSRVGDLVRMLSSECDGFAYDSAKVGDQVQFLARAYAS
jgi:hypothetical protein